MLRVVHPDPLAFTSAGTVAFSVDSVRFRTISCLYGIPVHSSSLLGYADGLTISQSLLIRISQRECDSLAELFGFPDTTVYLWTSV